MDHGTIGDSKLFVYNGHWFQLLYLVLHLVLKIQYDTQTNSMNKRRPQQNNEIEQNKTYDVIKLNLKLLHRQQLLRMC
jgi:hypothetical protein